MYRKTDRCDRGTVPLSHRYKRMQRKSGTKVDDKTYSVGYLNNKNKGKATLIVTGDGKASYGSKTQKFTIGAASLKDLDPLDIMRALGLKAKE